MEDSIDSDLTLEEASRPSSPFLASASLLAVASFSPMLFVNSENPAAMLRTRLTLRRSLPPYTKLRSAARILGESSASIRRATYGKHSSTMA